jgi:hypothetical protein
VPRDDVPHKIATNNVNAKMFKRTGDIIEWVCRVSMKGLPPVVAEVEAIVTPAIIIATEVEYFGRAGV